MEWGAKFRYTTEYNGIVNMFIGTPLFILAAITVGKFTFFLGEAIYPPISNGMLSILHALAVMILTAGILEKFGFYDQLNNLSTFLHVRRHLKTPITWRDAKAIKDLFLPGFDGKYYPLKEVLDLEQTTRVEYIIQFAKKVGRYHEE